MINESRDRTDQWADFLKSRCRKQLLEIGREWPHLRSIYIDYGEVIRFARVIPGTTNGEAIGGELADEILDNPGKVIEDIQDAITNNNLIKGMGGKEIKGNLLNIRFRKIGRKVLLRDLRASDIGKAVAIDCAITRDTEVKSWVSEAVFKCKAGHFTKKIQKRPGPLIAPDECSNDGCTFKKLELIEKRSVWTDHQRIKVQENTDKLKPGQQPQSMDLMVYDDQVQKLSAGDRVTLNCIVRSVQRVVQGQKSSLFDTNLDLSAIERKEGNFEEVEITEKDEETIKEMAKSGNALDMIAASIAPSIYGNGLAKRALALQMFGGITVENPDGSRTRGEIHIGLIGDPSSGKTQLSHTAVRQAPRGIFTTAATSSGGGLVGIAKQDDEGRWGIEAGVLALAAGGIAVIDEAPKMDAQTLAQVQSVMEDGSATITKAGITRVLKEDVALIFTGNPKNDRFDMYTETDLVDQIDLPPAIMSRLDLLILFQDKPETKRDTEISKHVLKYRYIAECRAAGKLDKLTEDEKSAIVTPVDPRLFKIWIAYSKRNIFPIMNSAVKEYLTNHYVELRGKTTSDRAPPGVRQQEALARLAEGSARIRLSSEVSLADAKIAVSIYTEAATLIAMDPNTKQVDWGKLPGQGTGRTKLNLILAIKETIQAEQGAGLGGVSIELIISKLQPRGFTNEHDIKTTIEDMVRKGDLMQPKSSAEKYRVI
jgi:replicative DNA helicase Mcm